MEGDPGKNPQGCGRSKKIAELLVQLPLRGIRGAHIPSSSSESTLLQIPKSRSAAMAVAEEAAARAAAEEANKRLEKTKAAQQCSEAFQTSTIIPSKGLGIKPGFVGFSRGRGMIQMPREKLLSKEASPKDIKQPMKRFSIGRGLILPSEGIETPSLKENIPSSKGKGEASIHRKEHLEEFEVQEKVLEKNDDFEEESLESDLEKLDVRSEPVVKKGETGEKLSIYCNYVMLYIDPGKGVFEFVVKFEPEVDYVAFRYELIFSDIKRSRGIKCYDGDSKLYMPEPITTTKMIINTKHPKGQNPVTITITFKKKLKFDECSQLYNILFNNISREMNLSRLGKQYYDHRLAIQIPQYKLEVWPGYVTTIKEFEGGIMLCCDIRHRLLRTQTAHDVLSNIAAMDLVNLKTLAEKELLGQYIMTRYNNNTYRIDDIDWDRTPESTFKLRSGKEVSFLEYYKVQYGLEINDLKQPLLISRPKKKNNEEAPSQLCLVPELCHLTGMSDPMKKDIRVMKDIAMCTKITPSQRNYAFMKFLKNLKANQKAREMLKEWGLRVADAPLKTEGRILPRESLIFKNETAVPDSECLEWSKFIRQYGVFRSTSINNWILIFPSRNRNYANSFKSTLLSVGPGLGVEITEPLMVGIKDDKVDTYIRGLRENATSNTQICVIICPTKREDRYSAVKKFCFLELNTHSQVLNLSTILRENRVLKIVQNIALQMNNKLGGATWAIQVPMKNAMVCGIDSYHDVSGKKPSVGAFVASCDSTFTKWFSKSCLQSRNQELLDGLINCFTSALNTYLKMNHVLPDRIVIFRDGVGDGQLSIVQKHEVKQFLDACFAISRNYKPKFTFIVVQKRINTKYYVPQDSKFSAEGESPSRPFQRQSLHTSVKDQNVGPPMKNPPAGSILDHTVTRRNYYDFFLISQYITAATARPCHYIVLYDNSNLKPDIVQRLTYKFCYLYYNWCGTIRVPAPCQYAHKLAFMIGENVKACPSEKFNTCLFYL